MDSTVELNFHETWKQHVEKFPTIDLIEIDCNKVKLDDEFKVHFENDPCDISIKKDCCMYSKGTLFKKKHFFANYVNWAVWSDLKCICNRYELNQRKEQESELLCWLDTY